MLLGPKQVYSQTTLIGGGQNFRGAIVTSTHRQLTITITGGTTVLRVEYKTMLRAERAEMFWFVPPFLTFWRHILATNKVNKYYSHIVGGKKDKFIFILPEKIMNMLSINIIMLARLIHLVNTWQYFNTRRKRPIFPFRWRNLLVRPTYRPSCSNSRCCLAVEKNKILHLAK